MLTEKDPDKIAEFKERKAAQWSRISDEMTGLQCVSSGAHGTQIMVVLSSETHYEGVVIGQLSHVVMETVGSPMNPRKRHIPDDRKPLDKREIDLSDDQLDQVVARWKAGQSARSLPFISAVFGRDGRPVL